MSLTRARIYGLGLEVNGQLAALAGLAQPGRTDIRLKLGELPAGIGGLSPEPYYVSPNRTAHGEPSLVVTRTHDKAWFHLAYADGTRIAIDRDGSRIGATWPASATVEDTATYLLGPTLGFALRLRGTLALHASAVAVDGHAIAFLGESGAGKSSIAAAFARAGCAVLSDDVVALSASGTSFEAQPAYPRVRLWDRSVEALFGHAEALPLITPSWEKRYLDLRGPGMRFQESPLPLGGIYVLCERDATGPSVSPLNPREAMMALVANTYANYLLDPLQRAREFDALALLVRHVPVRRLSLHTSLSALPSACDVIRREHGREAAKAVHA